MSNTEDFHRFEEFEELLRKYIEENISVYLKDEEYIRLAKESNQRIEDIIGINIFAYLVQYGFEATKKMLEGAKGRVIRIVPKKGCEHYEDYPLDYYYV